jgi:hypothetical protein
VKVVITELVLKDSVIVTLDGKANTAPKVYAILQIAMVEENVVVILLVFPCVVAKKVLVASSVLMSSATKIVPNMVLVSTRSVIVNLGGKETTVKRKSVQMVVLVMVIAIAQNILRLTTTVTLLAVYVKRVGLAPTAVSPCVHHLV